MPATKEGKVWAYYYYYKNLYLNQVPAIREGEVWAIRAVSIIATSL